MVNHSISKHFVISRFVSHLQQSFRVFIKCLGRLQAKHSEAGHRHQRRQVQQQLEEINNGVTIGRMDTYHVKETNIQPRVAPIKRPLAAASYVVIQWENTGLTKFCNGVADLAAAAAAAHADRTETDRSSEKHTKGLPYVQPNSAHGTQSTPLSSTAETQREVDTTVHQQRANIPPWTLPQLTAFCMPKAFMRLTVSKPTVRISYLGLTTISRRDNRTSRLRYPLQYVFKDRVGGQTINENGRPNKRMCLQNKNCNGPPTHPHSHETRKRCLHDTPLSRSETRQTDTTHVLHTTSAAAIHKRFPRLKLPNTMRLHPTRFFVKASPHDCILGAWERAVRARIESRVRLVHAKHPRDAKHARACL